MEQLRFKKKMRTHNQMNEGLSKLADFLGQQIEKLNAVTKEDIINNEIKSHLNGIISDKPFDVQEFSGGDATITVVNHSCNIAGYDATINGMIRFTVMKWDDNPCEREISEDGYFEGYVFGTLFNEEILIDL